MVKNSTFAGRAGRNLKNQSASENAACSTINSAACPAAAVAADDDGYDD